MKLGMKSGWEMQAAVKPGLQEAGRSTLTAGEGVPAPRRSLPGPDQLEDPVTPGKHSVYTELFQH